MLTKEIIENFGFPESLKRMDLVYCFGDELGDEVVMGRGCHCEETSVKFFLYNPNNHDTVFTMDFYLKERHKKSLFNPIQIDEPIAYLQHIGTNTSYRGRGIASYYVEKLVEFCENNGRKFLLLDIAPSEKNPGLDAIQLEKFYKSKETDKVKICFV
ncbi:GNAT family N-acetyltransferase [Enterococcus faecalis]|nr:GNAT family N-acetyltransferase [Enterococcus faecalis]